MKKIISMTFIYICLIFYTGNAYCFTFGESGISLNEFFSQCDFITKKACEIYLNAEIPKDMTIIDFSDSVSDASIAQAIEQIEKKGKDWKSRSVIMFSMAVAFKVINIDDTVKNIINSSTSQNDMQKEIQDTMMGGFNKLVNVYNIFHEENLIAGTPVAFINKLKEYFLKQGKDICEKYKGNESNP